MVYDWKNKSVIVTGGANGIGAQLLRRLVDEEAKYIALVDIDESNGKALQEELNAKYGKQTVHFHKYDVSVEEQIAAIFKSVVRECGHIDVLVNNAGICNDSESAFRKEIEINVTGLISCSTKALKLMRKDEGGKSGTIINVASVAALKTMKLVPIYAASKYAVLHFSRSIAMDAHYKRTGVRVMTVCFGPTSTNIFKNDVGPFDDKMNTELQEKRASVLKQTAEAAALGLLEMYKKGENGSTWLVMDTKTKDISENVNKAYALLSESMA